MFELNFMLGSVPEIIRYIPITVLMALVSCLIGWVLQSTLFIAAYIHLCVFYPWYAYAGSALPCLLWASSCGQNYC